MSRPAPIRLMELMERALPDEAHGSHVAVLSALIRLADNTTGVTEAPVDDIAARARLKDRATRKALKDLARWRLIHVVERRRPGSVVQMPSRITLIVPCAHAADSAAVSSAAAQNATGVAADSAASGPGAAADSAGISTPETTPETTGERVRARAEATAPVTVDGQVSEQAEQSPPTAPSVAVPLAEKPARALTTGQLKYAQDLCRRHPQHSISQRCKDERRALTRHELDELAAYDRAKPRPTAGQPKQTVNRDELATYEQF